jgi:LEA14-like dessication related protein
VTISDLTVVRASLLEQEYDITLRTQNPNRSPLEIDGVAFELELNDRPFAKGVGSQPVVVPRFGSALMRVEAVSTLASVLKQFSELPSGQPPILRYRLKGTLSLKDSLLPIPFDEQGEVNFGSLKPAK